MQIYCAKLRVLQNHMIHRFRFLPRCLHTGTQYASFGITNACSICYFAFTFRAPLNLFSTPIILFTDDRTLDARTDHFRSADIVTPRIWSESTDLNVELPSCMQAVAGDTSLMFEVMIITAHLVSLMKRPFCSAQALTAARAASTDDNAPCRLMSEDTIVTSSA